MNEENNPRVTIDTNLVISGAIISNSIPGKLLTAFSDGKLNWVLTEEIYEEIKNVLNRDSIKDNYHIKDEAIESFLENLAVGAELITPITISSLPINSHDPKDDKFLTCALSGNCGYLITCDEDLLILNGRKELGTLKIITAKEFLDDQNSR